MNWCEVFQMDGPETIRSLESAWVTVMCKGCAEETTRAALERRLERGMWLVVFFFLMSRFLNMFTLSPFLLLFRMPWLWLTGNAFVLMCIFFFCSLGVYSQSQLLCEPLTLNNSAGFRTTVWGHRDPLVPKLSISGLEGSVW